MGNQEVRDRQSYRERRRRIIRGGLKTQYDEEAASFCLPREAPAAQQDNNES